VADFLDDKRKEITDRLKELKPLVDEYHRLESAAVALAEAIGSTVGTAASEAGAAAVATVTRPRGPGRPRSSSTGKKGPGGPKTSGKKVGRPAGSGKRAGRPKGKVGRRKGSGTRAAQALSFVQGQPGITIPELAAKMGISPNYLYRILPGLEQDGKLEKKGRGWYPRG
jgi:hypothetical protein